MASGSGHLCQAHSTQATITRKTNLFWSQSWSSTFLVGKAPGEHSRIHCYLENFFLGIDRNCSMWLLVVVHSTQDHYKMKKQALFKPEVVKYLSGVDIP